MTRARLLGLALVVFSIWIAVTVLGPLDRIPRVRVAATSPDGKFSVEVLQKRLKLFPNLRFGVYIRVTDENRREVYNRLVFEDGWWSSDMGEMYKQIVFEEDRILVGPRFHYREYVIVKHTELSQLDK